jgi:hypothetical protein
MEMGFDPPVLEPLGRDFLDTAENEIDWRYPDPLARMLENLENSIEGSLPPEGMPDAPPDTMLDMVERSTEGQPIPSTQLPEHMQDPLHDLLDTLETATESQVIKPEEQIEAPASEPDKVYGSFPQAVAPRIGEARYLRERHFPECRMTGTQTGVRYNSGGMTYCRLYEKWLLPDECDRCNAFEPADDASGDNEHCRYAF